LQQYCFNLINLQVAINIVFYTTKGLYTPFNQPLIMTALTIEVLKKIIEHIPEDYTVEFDNGKNKYSIDDKVEIDVSMEKLILKKY